MRKIIVHQKNSQKPIILTDDSDQKIKDLKNQILEIFKSEKIYTLETKNDLLIGRSTDLQSILISGICTEELNDENTESKYQEVIDSTPVKKE